MKNPTIVIFTSLALFAVGCSSSQTEAPGDPTTKKMLSVRGDCDFQSCGVPPSSLDRAPVLTCEESANEACHWSPSSTSASYRFCADSECPPKPQIECPADTVHSSQQCGSENDGPCRWTTSCAPPRNTTPCPDPHACDELPLTAIGIICRDGSTGGFVCVTDGQRCNYERNCD